ncbi:hypothetical protein [Nocardia nepalensis]|uniref:hypothetical protein n=1 Tax=Nocardia nepalensis TaxID=3375448 RepID=UPI003B67BFE1
MAESPHLRQNDGNTSGQLATDSDVGAGYLLVHVRMTLLMDSSGVSERIPADQQRISAMKSG